MLKTLSTITNNSDLEFYTSDEAGNYPGAKFYRMGDVVREKRDFYKNASHINYKVETERSKSVSVKIENTMYPCFGD